MITMAFWRKLLYSDTAHGMERDWIFIGVIFVVWDFRDIFLIFFFCWTHLVFLLTLPGSTLAPLD